MTLIKYAKILRNNHITEDLWPSAMDNWYPGYMKTKNLSTVKLVGFKSNYVYCNASLGVRT